VIVPEILAEHFELLADAPNGVQKLREVIVQLAVQGKLSEWAPGDEPAKDFIKAIHIQKLKLVDAKSIPKPRRTPSIDPRALPYDLPAAWEWIRLESLCEVITKGSSPKWQGVSYVEAPTKGILFITSENVGNYTMRKLDEPKYVESKFNEMETRSILERGDILVNLVGASIGRSALWDRDDVANINQAVGIIRLVRGKGSLNRRYLLHYLNSPTCLAIMFENQVETARANISLTNVKEFLVPIPPRAEQRRIVAKVDQLMALCDELDQRQQERNKARVRLSTASHAALTTAATSKQFTRHWNRIRNHFDLLYDTPQNVQELRRVILQLAVQGKLLARAPQDKSAFGVVDRVTAKRARLVEQKRIPNRKALAPLEKGELPFAAEPNWAWMRFGEMATISSGVTLGRKLEGRETASYPYLRVANVQRWRLDLTKIKQVEIPVNELEKYRLEEGDILMTEGGDWDKLGRAAVWEGQIENCLHQNHIFRARPLSKEIRTPWLLLYLNSPVGREYFQDSSKQTTNLASINMTQLRHCPVPLPSPAIQDRIIARVDQLMAVCDDLESKLTQSQADSEKLMEAVKKKEGLAGVGA